MGLTIDRLGHWVSKRRSEATLAGRVIAGRPVWHLVLRFIAYWAALVFVAALLPNLDSWAIRATANTVRLLLQIKDGVAGAPSDQVNWGGVTLQIDRECTPLQSVFVLWAALFATPARWTRRLMGALVGAFLLCAYNLARIVTLAAVLRWQPRMFDFVHIVLWQAATLVVVLGCYLIWVRRWSSQSPRT